MYIRELHLRDVRTFGSPPTKVIFEKPGSEKPLSNVTLLVGTNGAGKTTILRSVGLAAIAPVLSSSGFVPRSFARRGQDGEASRGTVMAGFEFTPEDGVDGNAWDSTLSFVPPRNGWVDRMMTPDKPPKWSEAMWEEHGPAFFVVGYGASRRVENSRAFQVQEKERHFRFLRIASLFEDSVVLRPLNSWLALWDNPGRRKQLIQLLNAIIGGAKLVEAPRENEFFFDIGGTRLPFDALSDGYRAYIGWVADLLYHVTRGVPSGARLNETAGIALVDEIDLHMHPRWQREVLPRLAQALPRMQFICTTHSPLVIGSVHQNNIRVLREKTGQTHVTEAEVESHGLSSDQILTSPFFALDSTRAPQFEEQLQTVAREARRGDAEQAKRYLRMLTLGQRALDEPTDPPTPSTQKRPMTRKRVPSTTKRAVRKASK